MKSVGFLFRTFLLAIFTLSLLGGAIVTDFYLRHETTRKAKRFLAAKGVEMSPESAIEAAYTGELAVLENLEHAGVSLGNPDATGRTPLLAAIQARKPPVVHFLMERAPVRETINRPTNPDRKTPLVAALGHRDFELADRLIDAGAEIDVDREAGLPFLIHAIETDDEEMWKFLLDRGADVEYRGAHPASALAVAAHAGRIDHMKRLIEAGADASARGVTGKSLLIEAVKEQNREEFDLLLASGADVNATTGDAIGMEMSALSFAVANGNVEMQELLLEKGASTEVYGVSGEPLICEVVSRGDRVTSDRLLAKGASAEVVTGSGETPLSMAVAVEDLEMVDLLLGHGADPSFHPESEAPPLLAAIELGNIAISNQLIVEGAKLDGPALLAKAYEIRDDPLMSLLLNAGVDPESTFPGTEERVFDVAVRDGAAGSVRTLLASGAKIGNNLWAALLTGQDDLIRLILDAGADPRQAGPEGDDPLNWCLTRHRYRAARELLAGGANPDARYNDEESWLSKSIREGNAAVALTLLEAGAAVTGVRARDGHTLLGWAIAHQQAEVVEALLAAGADPDTEERAPARSDFREMFDSKTFKYHLQVDRRIRPIMMAAAQRNHEIAQMLMDAGANGRAYTPKYLMAGIIGSWYKDARMQQIALLGEVPKVQPRKLVIDLSSQRATLYEKGVATYSTRVSTGKPGYRTPAGEYVISDRHRHHNSTIYGSSMPYFQRFSYAAFGIHQGYVPNYPASHGCIRLPYESARYLFGKMEVGDYCVIQQ